jgi:hypothetical protein
MEDPQTGTDDVTVTGVAEVNILDPGILSPLPAFSQTSGQRSRDHMNLIGTPQATLKGPKVPRGRFLLVDVIAKG